MEINVLEENKKRMLFEIPGEGHTLCNIVKSELVRNAHVKAATYTIKHPLIPTPVMLIDTDSTQSPREALIEAIGSLGETIKDFKKEFDKAAK